MSGVWGNRVKISIFGESHGKAIGINIDGLPSGFEVDLAAVTKEMQKRAPGQSPLSTPRSENDQFEILSGFFYGKTTGTPLCAVIYNTNTQSKDYEKTKSLARPSHADYTGHIKYKGYNDYRGGGHFSGRVTAPLVFAGAICRQILEKKGIVIGSHIRSIYDVDDLAMELADTTRETLEMLLQADFPVLDLSKGVEMKAAILKAKGELDSVGGVIETAVINLEPGLGEPFFNSIESHLAQLLFSIPGVKGVEFGAGFEISRLRGSQANDAQHMEDGKVKTLTNNNGGVLGGITNGMPLVFRTAIKPTPSIGKVQKTVDLDKKENATLAITGRHDPCIVPRAVPIVEAVAAIALLDLMLMGRSISFD